ncbi:MAG: hypothetical protein COV99_05750 [Bacteroidetes bacterium CG12_big_fil_rev_8_21_14_0_65_60_17]|nr:MAG: hypothetical protein COV99_05750 [Bacteroidetes bacterium CG12_big_fil_rev_8_21_14_0_65_60_17]
MPTPTTSAAGSRPFLSTLLLGTLLFGILVLPGALHAQDRVALMTDIKGTVEVARAGEATFKPADWGSQLFEGDQVRTGADSKTALLFANGNMVSLDGGSTMTISATTTDAPSLSGPVREVGGDLLAAASDLALHRAGEGEIAVLGGLRSGGGTSALRTLAPVNTRIAVNAPTFSWSATDDFDSYRVTVSTSNGEVFSGDTDGTSWTWPAHAPELTAGTTYFWRVEADNMLDTVASPLASFVLLPTDERRAVEHSLADIENLFSGGTDNQADYLLGSVYVKHGLLADAISIFSGIAERNPQSAAAHRILGSLYADAGMKDEAIQSLQRAVAASENQ